MMNPHEKQMALITARGRLVLANCFILRVNYAPAIPVIEITNPSEKLKKKAVAVMEMRHGTLNKMYVARFSKCLVRWWSGECQQYVGNTVINSEEDEHELRTMRKLA
ncbi:hypothetical protein [Vibrio gazogenes]|uniref:Uncharacterized protein n=1 Tax=Vibrio gazogenes DSM 21264 = NBRC 103151 TaxID=1123492 RepID=A0A1M5F7D5_VIBGA|nr:hypothetical protein [Vibrio gazogenes]USP15439.1 hypothetical protein MKS89_18745 [Vibrio gazogenes]SHF87436.1 hypothetical protein SAMN02745781_03378 [Vibrio gazogenes DSM 21264] [Vibrio gazogenes DSM 21264 = NBRC 103151]SJN54500.1 hypothetical protein BQ6471_01041 [Vibrio gazogenes]